MKALPFAILLLLGLPLAAAPAARAEDKDHDRARRAVESGEIRPLRDILADVEKTYGGQLVEAELDREHGRLVYELKLLTADGRVLKLYYDAQSGKPLTPDHQNRRK